MELEACFKRIDSYLNRIGDNRPRFVNVQNAEDLQCLISRYNLRARIIRVGDYAKLDENPREDAFWQDLSINDGTMFLVGFTTYWKLKGREELKAQLEKLANYTGQFGHVVVICYQCEEYLKFNNPKLVNSVYCVAGEKSQMPQVVFMSANLPTASGIVACEGINELPKELEQSSNNIVYVKTKKGKQDYSCSLYHITEEKNAFEVLCKIDGLTNRLDEELATEEEWCEVLKLVSQYQNWNNLASHYFFSSQRLDSALSNYKTFDDFTKKLYLLVLKIFGAVENWCLDVCAKNMKCINDFERIAHRSLLSVDIKDPDFWGKYRNRNNLLNHIGVTNAELVDYCTFVRCKEGNELYYLNSSNLIEKQEIIDFLDKYGTDFTKKQLVAVLEKVYPDLASYLKDYHFQNDLFDEYFKKYKYQKVINRIFPEFLKLVEEQAVKRSFNILLDPRTAIVSKLRKDDSKLLFMDAMGVEYLGFIVEQCRQLGLSVKIKIARANLPTLTYCNKDFVDDFVAAGCEYYDEKRLDEIKHHGKENYDYEKKQQPLHLVEELEIIKNAIEFIEAKLTQKECKRFYLISDHGSSRLAVINESELPIDVNAKGKNGGRICPKSDDVIGVPRSAATTEDFYVLANYDRFRGCRKASVEVHGGATLEEIMVPVIEIYKQDETAAQNIEIFLKQEEYITKFKMPVKVLFFSKTALEEPSVIVNGKKYVAVSDDGNNYYVVTDIQKKGDYTMDVYDGDNLIKEGLTFKAVNAGMKSVDLL